ncbi:hypothetical protein WDU99_01760 [Microbacterium sp. Mu-80]|uniref:Uncharacterized protein n=1 Tax=Microbacterium bandirmense TaxID=3122050 RepID=A0ABU8L7E7_9MICO
MTAHVAGTRFESSPGRGPSAIQVAVDEAGNFGIWTNQNPRQVATMLRLIADEAEAEFSQCEFLGEMGRGTDREDGSKHAEV